MSRIQYRFRSRASSSSTIATILLLLATGAGLLSDGAVYAWIPTLLSSSMPRSVITGATKRRRREAVLATPLLSQQRKVSTSFSKFKTSTSLHVGQDLSSLLLVVADDTSSSWREYVPLVVSGLVIVDILLGQPALNLVLKPLRQAQEEAYGGGSEIGENDSVLDESASPLSNLFSAASPTATTTTTSTKKERIDSQQVAQEALDKAQNALELKRYLEDQKTDWDRMEDLRKQMDQQADKLNENLDKISKQVERQQAKGAKQQE